MVKLLYDEVFLIMEDQLLTQSLEDYLETIYMIIKDKNVVKPKDISLRLNVSQASVTGALRSLAVKKLILYSPYEPIELTSTGLKKAREILRRHELLRTFFTKVLLVDHQIADETACKMEHVIPKVILERLAQYIEYIENCEKKTFEWIEKSGYKCIDKKGCEECSMDVDNLVVKDSELGENAVSLLDIPVGKSCRVIELSLDGSTQKRLVDMGVIKNAIVSVERYAPLGDPIEIKINNSCIALRIKDASKIFVELV